MRDMVLAEQQFPEPYMDFVAEAVETVPNISHKNQMCSFIDTKKCMFGEKRTTIVPVNGNGERIATLILARYDRDFNDDDLLLAEYAAAISTAVPLTCLYAVSNLLFLIVLRKPIGDKLSRIRKKYGL